MTITKEQYTELNERVAGADSERLIESYAGLVAKAQFVISEGEQATLRAVRAEMLRRMDGDSSGTLGRQIANFVDTLEEAKSGHWELYKADVLDEAIEHAKKIVALLEG